MEGSIVAEGAETSSAAEEVRVGIGSEIGWMGRTYCLSEGGKMLELEVVVTVAVKGRRDCRSSFGKWFDACETKGKETCSFARFEAQLQQ